MKSVIDIPIEILKELDRKHGVKGLELVTMGDTVVLQYEDKTRYVT